MVGDELGLHDVLELGLRPGGQEGDAPRRLLPQAVLPRCSYRWFVAVCSVQFRFGVVWFGLVRFGSLGFGSAGSASGFGDVPRRLSPPSWFFSFVFVAVRFGSGCSVWFGSHSLDRQNRFVSVGIRKKLRRSALIRFRFGSIRFGFGRASKN